MRNYIQLLNNFNLSYSEKQRLINVIYNMIIDATYVMDLQEVTRFAIYMDNYVGKSKSEKESLPVEEYIYAFSSKDRYLNLFIRDNFEDLCKYGNFDPEESEGENIWSGSGELSNVIEKWIQDARLLPPVGKGEKEMYLVASPTGELKWKELDYEEIYNKMKEIEEQKKAEQTE